VATAFLELDNLATYFPVETGFIFKRTLGNVRAVDGVQLSIQRGEVLGLVGRIGLWQIGAWPHDLAINSADRLGRKSLRRLYPRAGN
jgi:ABC-type antimicrobial peptide transport system ATPase subunit